MDKDKRSFSPPVVGGSSLLVIFAVLCLTIFALLSLSTVLADERLGDASAEAVAAYYAADCKAEELLARIRAGEVPDGVACEEDWLSSVANAGTYRYSVPISETRELAVEVYVTDANHYRVLRWQALPVGEWSPDDSLNVWDGGMEDGEFTPFF